MEDNMYDYILESKNAGNSIIRNREKILEKAVEYYLSNEIEMVYIVGSGTSYHAGLGAKEFMESILNIPVITEYAMDFAEKKEFYEKNALVIGISHAGRSSSTIKALDKAKEQGFYTIACTAEDNRPIQDHAEILLKIEVGEETVGPKTKGYAGSVVTLVAYALEIAKQKGNVSSTEYNRSLDELKKSIDNIPEIAEQSVEWYERNKSELIKSRRIIIIGYNPCKSALLEGTLKILETVRYSVTAYDFEEFMHGVYHSIDKDAYVFYIGKQGENYQRLLQLKKYFEEERENNNYLIASDKKQIGKTNFIYDFTESELFSSLEFVVPLQVLAYKLSKDLGINPNKSSDPDFHKKMKSYTF